MTSFNGMNFSSSAIPSSQPKSNVQPISYNQAYQNQLKVTPTLDPNPNNVHSVVGGMAFNAAGDPIGPAADYSGGSAPAPTATDTSGSGGGGGSVTYVTAAPAPVSNWSPQDEAAYQQGVQVANNGLARIPNQLAIADANIGDQYNQQNNSLNSSKDAAQSSYNNSTTQNKQQFVTNKNTITDQASQGINSLLRLLGMHGAGGSSTALFSAPEAVATHAAQQRSGAGQTYAANQQGLDTNWNNFLTDFGNKQKQLNDWQTQQLNQAQSQADTNKQSLLATLAQLNGNRTAAQGGNGVAAEQPYIDQINQLSGQIDSLGRFSPTYTGTTPVYTPKSLDSYAIQSAGGPQLVGQSGALADMTMPYFNLLVNGQKKDQQNQALQPVAAQ